MSLLLLLLRLQLPETLLFPVLPLSRSLHPGEPLGQVGMEQPELPGNTVLAAMFRLQCLVSGGF